MDLFKPCNPVVQEVQAGVTPGLPSDNAAVLQGYTKEVTVESENGQYSLLLLIKPDADLDDAFTAWDMEGQEFIRVYGWLWSVEPV